MRVLLAHDGSDGATLAARLVENVSWPTGTHVEVVHVIEPIVAQMPVGPWPSGAAGCSDRDEMDLVLGAKASLDDVAGTLRARGLVVDPVILHGAPVEVLLARIERDRPDLVVVGTRELDGLSRMILGSVSSALVDRSVAPVIVARTASIDRVVVATDGSEIADQAVRAVARWPFLANSEIRVLSVAPEPPVWWPAEMVVAVPAAAVEASPAYDPGLADHQRIAAAAADRLREAGLQARPEALSGSPGSVISAYARDAGADIVIVGSHGRTGLPRIVLGSVAQHVLRHAPCSVLVVRRQGAPVRARPRRMAQPMVGPHVTI